MKYYHVFFIKKGETPFNYAGAGYMPGGPYEGTPEEIVEEIERETGVKVGDYWSRDDGLWLITEEG